MSRGDGGGGGEQRKERVPSVGEVIRNEERGVFRKMDLSRRQSRLSQADFNRLREKDRLAFRDKNQRGLLQDREKEMSTFQDWQSVWPAVRTFQPSVVPLPVRQGFIHLRSQVHPGKYANAELMKIPNFLHLTPPVVEKQAKSLRKFCTPFPKEDLSKEFPIQETTYSYLNASSSLRDHRARVVQTQFKVGALKGTPRFQDKVKRLLRERYSVPDDTATIVTDACPYRTQNQEYASYLITALFHESRKVEDWESQRTEKDMVHYDFALREEKGDHEAGDSKYVLDMKNLLEEGETKENIKKYQESVLELFEIDLEEKSESSATK